MSDKRHTPGRWDAIPKDSPSRFEVGTDTRHIATVHGGSDEAEANARLITASPAMLKGLLEAEWSAGGETPRCPVCGRPQSDGHLKGRCPLGDALAQAEGES